MIVVTGATGNVGRQVVAAAEDAGVAHVVVLSSLSAGWDGGPGADLLQRRHVDVEKA